MGLLKGSWQATSVIAIWQWENHMEGTMSLLCCFKARNTKSPLSLGLPRPVSVLVSGTNQFGREGAKLLSL